MSLSNLDALLARDSEGYESIDPAHLCWSEHQLGMDAVSARANGNSGKAGRKRALNTRFHKYDDVLNSGCTTKF
jgi:hypothetical protein